MGRRASYEAPDMAAFVTRVAKAMVRRAGEGDLEALSAVTAMSTAVDQAMTDAARAAHAAGYSWTQIAAELGISRQAARQRFAPISAVSTDESKVSGMREPEMKRA